MMSAADAIALAEDLIELVECAGATATTAEDRAELDTQLDQAFATLERAASAMAEERRRAAVTGELESMARLAERRRDPTTAVRAAIERRREGERLARQWGLR